LRFYCCHNLGFCASHVWGRMEPAMTLMMIWLSLGSEGFENKGFEWESSCKHKSTWRGAYG
jgi:hypothetical protein